ncbi:BadF/BadG/BcrA/BcrD ATPase family protein [Kineosporia sp. R_H_3]|uniref:BadF/BadG/BcrA/BcrD ATPase family protein n=1 Tax=Kineosporia sp. R_H_3 TaxID=1961848 RepID=UPI0013042EAD|nr:BadF/BadG/BcrA/BcrD ATPase family protein [Kineosporia sp. R_H_3]
MSAAGDAVVAAVEGGPEGLTAVLASRTGEILSTLSGPGDGAEPGGHREAARHVAALLARTAGAAGLADGGRLRLAGLGVFVSGFELDEEADQLSEALAEVVEAREIVVDDPALALLYAGAPGGEGVAVRCGAVTGCASSHDGLRQRFPSLGRVGGEWGGSVGLGEEALWWAARAGDGRGVPTMLERLAPLALGHPSCASVARALRRGELSRWRIADIAPVVMRAASAGDSVALQLLDRQAAELALTAHMALDRSGRLTTGSVVVLGGGVLETDAGPLVDGVHERLAQVAPKAVVRTASRPAVTGALDLLVEHLDEAGRRAARAARAAAGRRMPAVRPPA